MVPEAVSRAGAALGCPISAVIGRTGSSGPRTLACLGPDEWLLLTAEEDGADAAEALDRHLHHGSYSLVDVGHRDVGIAVEGREAARALSAGCAIDLDALAVGDATRTSFDRVQVVLMRTGDSGFRMEVWRSFSPHVWGLLEAVAAEIASGL